MDEKRKEKFSAKKVKIFYDKKLSSFTENKVGTFFELRGQFFDVQYLRKKVEQNGMKNFKNNLTNENDPQKTGKIVG